jgi:hypothetical protein
MQNIERLATGEDVVSEFNDVQQLLEKTEQFYDSLGLSLSLAVLKNNVIVLSSKHWLKNYYIEVQHPEEQNNDKFVYGLWDILVSVSREIKREFDRCNGVTHYLYITNLNRAQTAKVYDAIIQELQDRKLDFDVVQQYNPFGWYVTTENAVGIPWVVGIDWE